MKKIDWKEIRLNQIMTNGVQEHNNYMNNFYCDYYEVYCERPIMSIIVDIKWKEVNRTKDTSLFH